MPDNIFKDYKIYNVFITDSGLVIHGNTIIDWFINDNNIIIHYNCGEIEVINTGSNDELLYISNSIKGLLNE